jgi:hypothetical protein
MSKLMYFKADIYIKTRPYIKTDTCNKTDTSIICLTPSQIQRNDNYEFNMDFKG